MAPRRGRVFSGAAGALIISAALVSWCRAGELGGRAGAFLRVGAGADRVAMGDAGVAVVGGEVPWYYNPAGLPYLSGRQASVGYRHLSLGRTLSYVSWAMPLKPNAGLAFGFMRAGSGEVDARDYNGDKLDPLSFSDNVINGSFALSPHPRLGLGISIRYFISAVPDVLRDGRNLYAYAMGVDFGVRASPASNLHLGLQVRDLNAKLTWETTEVWDDEVPAKEDALPGLVRAGLAWDPIPDLTAALDVVLNPDRIGDESEAIQPRMGLEYRRPAGMRREAVLRAGWNSRSPAFGLGLDFDLNAWRVKVDLAYVIDRVAPSGSVLGGCTLAF